MRTSLCLTSWLLLLLAAGVEGRRTFGRAPSLTPQGRAGRANQTRMIKRNSISISEEIKSRDAIDANATVLNKQLENRTATLANSMEQVVQSKPVEHDYSESKPVPVQKINSRRVNVVERRATVPAAAANQKTTLSSIEAKNDSNRSRRIQLDLVSQVFAFIETISRNGNENLTKLSTLKQISFQQLLILFAACVCGFLVYMLLRFLLKMLGNSMGVERQGVERQGIERQGVEQQGVEQQGVEQQKVKQGKGSIKFGKQGTWDGREKEEALKRKALSLASKSSSLSEHRESSTPILETLASKSSSVIADRESSKPIPEKEAIKDRPSTTALSSVDSANDTSQYDTSQRPSIPILRSRLDFTEDVCTEDDFAKQFSISSSLNNQTLLLSWMTPAEAESAGLRHACVPVNLSGDSDQTDFELTQRTKAPDLERIPAPWTQQALQQLLAKYEVDASSWQEEKVQALAMELQREKSFLMVTPMQQLRLVVDFLELVIISPDSEVLVAENDHHGSSIGSRRISDHGGQMQVTPCIRRNAGETIPEAAQRCFRERLGLTNISIAFNWNMIKSTDAEETSNYSGLTTIVRKRCVAAKLEDIDSSTSEAVGLSGTRRSFQVAIGGQIQVWAWKAIEQVPQLAKHRTWFKKVTGELGVESQSITTKKSAPLRMLTRGPTRGSLRLEQNDDLKPVAPWTEQEVKALLDKHNTDTSAFSTSLKELSAAASFNSLYFCRRRSDDHLVCVHDEVSLRLLSPGGRMLLAQRSDDSANPKYSWLKCMKRLDESAWDTVRRLVRVQLALLDDAVEFCLIPQELGSEGDRVVNRSWIMSGHIPENKRCLCNELFE